MSPDIGGCVWSLVLETSESQPRNGPTLPSVVQSESWQENMRLVASLDFLAQTSGLQTYSHLLGSWGFKKLLGDFRGQHQVWNFGWGIDSGSEHFRCYRG